MNMDDKLIDYLGVIKSPFDEETEDQVGLEEEAYIRYCRDCILESIGTPRCQIQIDLHWLDTYEVFDDDEKKQFVRDCMIRMVDKYKMEFLPSLINQYNIPAEMSDDQLDLFLTIETDKWIELFAKCFSYFNPDLLNSVDKIKVFISADYDNFVKKLTSYQRINVYLKNYFMYCSGTEGKIVLFNICKKDFSGLVVKQTELNKNPQTQKD